MNKYQSYKTSSIEWIGVIPSNWEEIRLKYVGKLYGGLTGKSGDDFKQEDNPNNKPYIPYTNIFRNTYISKSHVDFVVLEDGENQNKVQKFDLFFLMSSETFQDLGKSCILVDDIEELYLNSFCKGFRVNKMDVNPLFLNYQLLGSVHKELISIEGRGFTRINLRQDRLNETPIILPPINEQLQIVQFLDEKTELIDKLISTKERKLTLLKEQRISLINELVTKGLNPNVKMKNSGVDWIGSIPVDFEIKKLKYIFKEKKSTKNPNLSSGSISFGKVVFKDDEKILESTKDSYQEVLSGEFLINPLNLNFDLKSLRIGKSEIDVVVSQGYIVLKLNSGYFPKYFEYLLRKFDIIKMKSLGNGVRQTISFTHLKDEFLVNPSLEIQKEIVEFIDLKTKEIDDLVQLEKKKIDLLKEYRQSLISEVVTGKIKVTTDE
jgi:type I restriction enzyme S subunit